MEDSGKFIEKMMELGIGMSMIQQMPAMINGVMQQPGVAGTSSAPVQAPPPVHSEAQVYLVIDNMQAGPFSEEELVKLIQNDMFHPADLVWQSGMSTWAPASQVPAVNKLFLMAKLK